MATLHPLHAHAGHQETVTFGELLVDSLKRTPWFMISLILHLVLFLFLSRMEFGSRAIDRTAEILVSVERPTLEEVVPIEPPVDDVEVVPEEEIRPDLQDVPTEVDEPLDPVDALVEEPSDDPFANGESIQILTLGGPGDGPFGIRRVHGGPGTRSGPAEEAVRLGLAWLARHQSEDGSWDCDGFGFACDGTDVCDGPGHPAHDVGVTGLALLAFLGAGHTHDAGEHRDTVKRGLAWLRDRQDEEGCFGSRTFDNFTYGHAIAALAMAEAYGMTKSSQLHRHAQRGIDFIHECKNPRRAWRYGVKPGDDDTSVTGWMVMAMKSAKLAGLRVHERDFLDVRDFLDEVTDETGRAGYVQRGVGPVRPAGKEEAFPSELSESLTAVAVLSRIFVGENPATSDPIRRGAERCVRRLPEWDPPKRDFYYWYYGTLAMYQVGGRPWEAWNRAMQRAIVDTQRRDASCARGSWDPVDAWGEEGGRVYATALLTMCLEVYYRYDRVFGTSR